MKSNVEIVQIIKDKASEHEKIMNQLAKDVEVLRQKLAEMIQAKTAKDALVTQTQAMMVLKDKMVFHKACFMQLEELIKEIE